MAIHVEFEINVNRRHPVTLNVSWQESAGIADQSKTRLFDLRLRRRLRVYLRRFLLANLVIVALYRGPIEYSLWSIQSVGGQVTHTSPRSWLFSQCGRHLPASMTSSKSFQRLFWPRVNSIDLRNVTENTDSAIRAATRFPELRYLTLYRSGATDDDIQLVASSFHALVELNANETAITDAVVPHLRQMPSLRTLNIQRTAVGNSSVDGLLAIPRLKELLVGDTKIDSNGMARLRARIPIVRTMFVTKTRCKTCMQFLSYCRCGSKEGSQH